MAIIISLMMTSLAGCETFGPWFDLGKGSLEIKSTVLYLVVTFCTITHTRIPYRQTLLVLGCPVSRVHDLLQ